MKRLLALTLTLASGFALNAAAQNTCRRARRDRPRSPSSPFQVAVAQTNEGQREFADLQKKYAPKEAQLKALSEEVDGLTKQLQTQGDKLSEAERGSRAKAIDDKKKQLQRSAEDAQNDFQQEMQGDVQRTGLESL